MIKQISDLGKKAASLAFTIGLAATVSGCAVTENIVKHPKYLRLGLDKENCEIVQGGFYCKETSDVMTKFAIFTNKKHCQITYTLNLENTDIFPEELVGDVDSAEYWDYSCNGSIDDGRIGRRNHYHSMSRGYPSLKDFDIQARTDLLEYALKVDKK